MDVSQDKNRRKNDAWLKKQIRKFEQDKRLMHSMALIRQGSRIRKLKRVPSNCRTPKQVCIHCQRNYVHKLNNGYDSKTCNECLPR